MPWLMFTHLDVSLELQLPQKENNEKIILRRDGWIIHLFFFISIPIKKELPRKLFNSLFAHFS